MMEQLLKFLNENRLLVIGGAAAGTLGLVGYCYYYNKQSVVLPFLEYETDRTTFTKPDHVYLMIPPRIGAVPSISPFCVKLETWLRMTAIPHEVVETFMPSPSKNTFPYIYLNGEELADSKFIIERCSRHFGKPVNKHLTEMETAIFTAYSHLLEEHLVITYGLYRYTVGAPEFWANFKNFKSTNPLAKFMGSAQEMMKSMVVEKAYHRGIGRHSNEEIYSIADEDLKALSVYLGDRDYFFGREPTVIDCTIFGHISQLVYIKTNFPPGRKLPTEYKNLKDHADRIKNRYYPDWDSLCQTSNQ